MGIFDRITGREKPIAELTDAELEDELLRRRRERAARRSGATGAADQKTAPDSPERKQLMQYYANLELRPGASVDEIKAAYRELMRRYHPDKHMGDPERHRAATELTQSLTRAYESLLAHAERSQRER